MKALVIGATGIIGNHIVRELLADGHEVVAASRGVTPSLNLNELNISFTKLDLMDADSLKRAFQGVDWVFQAAAYYPKNAFQRAGHAAAAPDALSGHRLQRVRHPAGARAERGVRL